MELAMVDAVEKLHEQKPAVLLALLKRLNMDHNVCVEKDDIIRCVRGCLLVRVCLLVRACVSECV